MVKPVANRRSIYAFVALICFCLILRQENKENEENRPLFPFGVHE